MTVWTLHQISQVRGLWAEAEVDRGLYARWGIEPVRYELAKHLFHEAHAFVVEVHRDDVAARDVTDDETPEWKPLKIRAGWSPVTTEVELAGGHVDGQLVNVARPGEPLVVPAPVDPFTYAAVWESPMDPSPRRWVYSLSGWNESARRWVYSLDA